ncbi:MAG: hypothetical protein E4H02_03610 [Lentisphaerales bacterium]|jgi:hypothetical protein|nr:MAG: hypothetical protein E4H02_03610 [Lentisphaerales bacterium]
MKIVGSIVSVLVVVLLCGCNPSGGTFDDFIANSCASTECIGGGMSRITLCVKLSYPDLESVRFALADETGTVWETTVEVGGEDCQVVSVPNGTYTWSIQAGETIDNGTIVAEEGKTTTCSYYGGDTPTPLM